MSDAVIGWDVGGAHLKAARVEQGRVVRVVQLPSPLWMNLDSLTEALRTARRMLGPAGLHVATMTGELADVFPNRAEGVARLTETLVRELTPVPLRLYAGRAGFLEPEQAARHVADIASANWHASASLVGRCTQDALFIDMGSTTTDIVPVAGGRVVAKAYTDAERMQAGELIYTGLVRSFLMALTDRAPVRGAWTRIAAEYFASSADVYRILGELPEAADQMPTADGREKTVEASRARLARMVGRDAADLRAEEWRALAFWFAEQQLRLVGDGVMQVCSRGDVPDTAPVIGAGVGRHVVAKLAARFGRRFVDFADLLVDRAASRDWLADCAPAAAVALLGYTG
jgi:probable H4MPT-linked C1 transfer pathway protein